MCWFLPALTSSEIERCYVFLWIRHLSYCVSRIQEDLYLLCLLITWMVLFDTLNSSAAFLIDQDLGISVKICNFSFLLESFIFSFI